MSLQEAADARKAKLAALKKRKTLHDAADRSTAAAAAAPPPGDDQSVRLLRGAALGPVGALTRVELPCPL